MDTPTTSNASLSPEYRPLVPPPADAPPPAANGTEIFQHYQVLRREDGSLWELGRGTMGVTYRAFDKNLRCQVALKVINAQYLHSEMAGQRFIREARVAARLRHRNIATVYHLGVDPQSYFYAMEFIDGETLENLIERAGPLPLESVLCIGLQTARALAVAARQGLIHRDIKPANLMVLHEDEEGEEQLLVKVIDFGLARSYDPHDSNSQLTATGFVGTPLYSSPEQLEERDLDIRSDIYSLGVTMWILLTGNPPFDGKMTQVITQHLHTEPPWWQLGDCPEPARALLEKMLRKDPQDRFQTAHELRRAIEGCLERTPGWGKRIVKGQDGPTSRPSLKEALRMSRTPGSTAAAISLVKNSIGRRWRKPWKPVAIGAAVMLLCATGLLFRRSSSSASDAPQPVVSVAPKPATPPTPETPAASPPPKVVATVSPAPTMPPVVDADPPAPTMPASIPPSLTATAAVTPPPDETPAKPAADWSSPGDPQLRKDAPSTPDATPAVSASTPAASPSPEVAKDDHEEKAADDNTDSDAKGASKTSQHSHPHHTAHATPTPQPNFFQRMLGIKPKPTPKNR